MTESHLVCDKVVDQNSGTSVPNSFGIVVGVETMLSIHTISFLNTLLLGFASGLKVDISYSFRVPSQMGSVSPSSGNCCPHLELHDNSTHGMVRPLVFGLGAQKSGSSSLHSYLKKHPLFEGPNKKELDFLAAGNPNYTYAAYLKRWKSNVSRYKRTNGGTENLEILEIANFDLRHRFEVSPSYAMLPFSPCRAKWHFPEAKFVIFLREPVSRIISSYKYTVWTYRSHSNATYPSWKAQGFLEVVKTGLEKLKNDHRCDFTNGRDDKSFNDCIGCFTISYSFLTECEFRPMAMITGPNGKHECYPFHKELILRSLYGPQLSRWFEFFPPEQFFIVNSGNFFKDPGAVMTKVIDFLGVSQEFTDKMIKEDINSNSVRYGWALDPEDVSEAKALLREFFKRPNLELYRLLEEAGHGDFIPFEESLRGRETLNCSHPLVRGLDVCPKSIKVKYKKFPEGLAATFSRRFAGWTGTQDQDYQWKHNSKAPLILALLVICVVIFNYGYQLRNRRNILNQNSIQPTSQSIKNDPHQKLR